MEISRLDPSKAYLVRGATLAAMMRRDDDLWAGNNIQRGPGILRRGSGSAGFTLAARPGAKNVPSTGGAIPAWPFKVYNTTATTAGQVQINGGDGSVASLSPTDGTASGIACVNGDPTDTKTGSPAAYPQLSVTGNGVIYVICYLNSDGQIESGSSSGGTGVDVEYAGTVPPPDTASPPTYGVKLIATITGYATDGSGNVSFMVNDATGPVGITTVQVCKFIDSMGTTNYTVLIT